MELSQIPVKLNRKQQIQELSNVLGCLLPASVQVFNCIVLALQDDGVERDILVNKEFTRENLNVIVFDKSERTRWKICMFSNPKTNENLRLLLKDILDFTKPYLFWGLTRFQQDVIKSLYGNKQPKWAGKCQIVMDWDGSLQALTATNNWREEEDKEIGKYKIAKVLLDHASLVDNSWKFKNSLTLKMLEGLIQQERLLGLFVDGATEPVAWITICSNGSIGMLHTKEEYRRQGCAKVLVRAAKEYARSLCLVPYVHVEEDNLISAGLFENLGFIKDQHAVWIGYE